jgi:hypothetical protein
MTADNKVKENRIRRMADRQGLRLEKSRRRDPRAIDYGGFMLVNVRKNFVLRGGEPFPYSATLDEIEACLTRIESNADYHFFDLGMQYYAAGRYGVFVWLHPVAANLLHHAVEMCLKGGLAKWGKGLVELRQLGHSLPEIWKEFKAHADEASLDRLDEAMQALNAFEDLRYPNSVLEGGMQSTFNIRKSDVMPVSSAAASHPKAYDLCLEEVDEILGAVFKAAGINPEFYANKAHRESKPYLTRWNVWLTAPEARR